MMRRGENRAELASAAEELARSSSPEALARFHALSTQERAEDVPDDGGAAGDFDRLTG
jgi:hypothetical protein